MGTVNTIILEVFSPMNAKLFLMNTINEAMRHFKPNRDGLGLALAVQHVGKMSGNKIRHGC